MLRPYEIRTSHYKMEILQNYDASIIQRVSILVWETD